MEVAFVESLLFSLLFLYKSYAAELNTISSSQFLTDGDTLVSPAGTFQLGFFRPGSSDNRYLGIWYKNISVQTLVWVANRETPLVGSSRHELKIADPGILVLSNNITMIWSSNTIRTPSRDATARLSDSGNLMVINERQQVMWQSFDYPTDTLLPGMKLGRDNLRGIEWRLSSWKTTQDPAPGEYTLGPDENGYPENKLRRQGASVIFRDGPWNNQIFSSISIFSKSLTFRYDVVISINEVSFTYLIGDENIIVRVTLNSSGLLEGWVWVEEANRWQYVVYYPRDVCDTYNICNAYGTCSVHMIQQSCTCLDEKRFVPRNPIGWGTSNWTDGCIRRKPLACKNGTEGFIRYSYVKLPDTEDTLFYRSMTLQECQVKCLKNCTCMAYANPDPSLGGLGCLLWFNDLKDIRVYTDGSGGQEIFVKMDLSELPSAPTESITDVASAPTESRIDLPSAPTGAESISKEKGKENHKTILLVIVPGVLFIGFITTWLWCARRKHNHAKLIGKGDTLPWSESHEEDIQLPFISFATIVTATAGFSTENILGEGGFGPVYKGVLEEGREVAIKRLSKTSSQGVKEFKNEVIFISKLQHRNLVKLIGCCIHGDEKLLIYEYLPNKSLDSFIFDKTQSMILDWTKRFNIIKGIARGLLYLHHDSRLRIIHRDLKASNILLDMDMNPKISDFGIARSFGGNETEANTHRVVGTYGYMAPEYALDGLFSIKSDVFSFGVLVLEILSGQKNRGFIHSEHDHNLIGHAWSIYKKGRSMELIDENLAESCNPPEVIRSIQVGLLCVQQNAGDRPDMSSVVLMLGGERTLPQPKQPAFFMETEILVADYSSSTNPTGSINSLTITEVDSR